MAVAIADGPLGLEATHTWGAFVLNDVDNGLPRAKVDRIPGLHSLAEADDLRAPRTGRSGEQPYPSFARGKTIVYEGRLQARTLQELRALGTAMRAAFQERSTEGVMTIAPHPAYGSIAWTYTARVMQLDIEDRQEVGPSHMPTMFERPFTLGLRLSDARFYLAGPPQASGPHGDGAIVAVTNQGLAPSDRLVIAGDIAGTEVLVENLTVPTSNDTARLRLDTNYLGSTLQELAIDFDARTIIRTTGGADPEDAIALLDTAYSQWWDEFIPALVPGANQLRVTGLDGWTTAVVSATP